ncbi:MAG: tRNA (adenosine(37)-N6)-dimethylallyltransferase MiaA [Lachnospiraceae bacterium]|nr:tRNA (adenosine(37)-N6)-dimethylallyltransferase MiaA [Lachnospiraceae bacterium]
MEKKPLIIIAGPTATGKSALSIKLAHEINGEIISCDSMQVYKYMDIGSAKITPEEMDGVKHYLVDELMPDDEFNVARFIEMAKTAMEEIYSRGHIPICVGGTGFYINALLYDADFSGEEDADALQIRRDLELELAEVGNIKMHEKLASIDEVSARNIHPNNVKRVLRAIEFYEIHGYPISKHNEEEKAKESPYNFCFFVLDDEREKLYESIDTRVDKMVEMGLLEEVKNLYNMGYTADMVSMQGLGYKELFPVIEGKDSLEHAVEIIKRDTRRFAKRQLTWFRSKDETIWINKADFNYDSIQILDFMKDKIKEQNIL